MKKILSRLCASAIALSLLAACNAEAVPVSGGSVTEAPPAAGASREDMAKQSPSPVPTVTPTPEPTPEPTPAPTPVNYTVVKPYEVGHTMVLMYHGIVDERKPTNEYARTKDEFRSDLQALYDRGYRLLSLRDLMDNNVTTEAGYTPVVLTFDDGLASSFSLMEENGKLVPVPDCGLDILLKFAAEHPDFGMAATFYINGNNNPFQGAGTLAERLQFLIDNGCDVGNHTYSHADLPTLDAAGIQAELAIVDRMIRESLPGYAPAGVAYPFGHRPQEEDLRPYILSGEHDGWTYTYDFALRVGQSGASTTPNRVTFEPLNLARVTGSQGWDTDLWWFLNRYDEHPEYRYISDGDPETIVVPRDSEANVVMESLGGKQLIIYDPE